MHPNINFTFIAVNSKVSGNTEAPISTNFVDTSRPVFAWIACCTLIDIWKYATAKDMYKYAKYQEMWYLYYVFFICIDMKRKRSGKRLVYYCGTSVLFIFCWHSIKVIGNKYIYFMHNDSSTERAR